MTSHLPAEKKDTKVDFDLDEEVGKHLINIKKRGRPVKGSPFEVMVEPARGDGPQVGQPLNVEIEIPKLKLSRDLRNLEAELTRPSGIKEPLHCKEGPDDHTLNVGFVPKENGTHFVDIKKRGRPVNGSPFLIEVGPADSKPSRSQPIDGMVVPDICFTDDVPKLMVGVPHDFHLNIYGVKMPNDLNKLKAKFTRPSGKEDKVLCSAALDCTLAVTFTPEEVGKHLLEVRKNRVSVNGSPFEIMVEESPGAKPTVGNKCDVDFDIPGINLPGVLKHLKAKLTRPTGAEEQIPCKCSPENTLSLEFTPQEPGKHLIDVTKRGRPLNGSPFEVIVDPSSKTSTVGTEWVTTEL